MYNLPRLLAHLVVYLNLSCLFIDFNSMISHIDIGYPPNAWCVQAVRGKPELEEPCISNVRMYL